MKIKTRDELLQALADGRIVRRSDVSERVQAMRIYGSGAGFPGCLFDSGPDFHATKRDAVETALMYLDTGEGAPRGARADLLRYGSAEGANGWRAEVWAATVAECL